MRRLLLAGMIATVAHGANAPGPSQFYAVTQFFSDNGPAFYYRVLDVRQDGSGSLVRYFRVAPIDLYCRRIIIQATEARVRDESPAELVRSNNPCTVKPNALHSALRRYRQVAGGFETISFGIVAQCGSSPVSLGLPISERVDLTRLKADHPEIAHLWDLTSEVTRRVFGEGDVFHDRREEDDVVLQHEGEKLVPELVSGRYDIGLAAAVKGNVGTWKSPTFRSLLSSYRGPVSAAAAKAGYVPQLLNAQAYRFSEFVVPKFPLLALQARIEGKVELQASVRPATGEVNGVKAVSGHPLLRSSAIEAAKRWSFAPNSVPSETLTVTLDFSLRCP